MHLSEYAAGRAAVNAAAANDAVSAASNSISVALTMAAAATNASSATAAGAAATAAYRAAYAARSAIDETADEAAAEVAECGAVAARSAIAATDTAHSKARASAAIRRDYELLLAASRGGDGTKPWDEHTPVPPEFFGPLWPEGVPDAWLKTPSDESASGSQVLEIEIVVPKGMTPNQSREFNERVARFYAALSGAHAAMGGGGLRILDEGSCETADVEDEAPSDADCRGPLVGAGGGR